MSQKRIRIVTDSTCDIPKDLLERWQIVVIPCYIDYSKGNFKDDGVELDRDDFYETLAITGEAATTAAPSPALAEEMLHAALEGYDHVISIHVSGAFSSTVNNVRLAAQSLPQDRVSVVDSQTLTIAQGMQALMAAEIAEQTGDVDAVLRAVEQVRQKQKFYALLDTLENLRRSGRVSNLMAGLGSLLQIKPILDVHDSEVDAPHRIRTFRRGLIKLREMVEAQAPYERLWILHIRREDTAREFMNSLGDLVPDGTRIIEVGPTLGTHIGLHSIAVATLPVGWER